MDDSRKKYIPVNSIDYTAYIERLPVRRAVSNEIFLYGTDNLYPQKTKAIASRSGSLQTAIETLTNFTVGQGVEGLDDLILNDEGLKFPEFLEFISQEKSEIGFAVHCSFNRFGMITELTPVNFEFVRKKIKQDSETYEKYVISNNWEKFHFLNHPDRMEVYEFNPAEALTQIKNDGFENYQGQLFYWHHNKGSIYGLSTYDSVQDDAQLESDAKLYSLSNVQNGFSISGILKYPVNTDSMAKRDSFGDKISQTKSPINAGRIMTIPFQPQATIPSNLWESITLPNVDSMFQNQKEDAKKNIYEKFKQPSIVNGRSDSGMFNSQSMQDAFDFYNSVTAKSRKEVEKSLNTLFEFSIFDVEDVEIIPLVFISDETIEQDTDEAEAEVERQRAEAQANLKGTVGGVQGILQIQQSVAQGFTEYSSGIEILIEIYGFTEQQATNILGTPKTPKTQNNGDSDNNN